MGNKLVVANDFDQSVLVSVLRGEDYVDEKAMQISSDNQTNWYIQLKDLKKVDGNSYENFKWHAGTPKFAYVTVLVAEDGKIIAENTKVPGNNIVLITEEGKLKTFEQDKMDQVMKMMSDDEEDSGK